MIVKTIVQGLVAAAVIAAAGLAWAEGTAPPMPQEAERPATAAAVAGGEGTGYLPAILGGRRGPEGRDHDRDDDHEREDDDD